jgi:hypothetical protein
VITANTLKPQQQQNQGKRQRDFIHHDIKQQLTNEVLVKAFELDEVVSVEQNYFDVMVRPTGQHLIEPRDYNISEFIDYGYNIVVVGEAGSGKTTTLQYLASRLLNVGHDHLVIYASLHHVIDYALAINDHTIIAGLSGYLTNIVEEVSESSLNQHFSANRSVVILDSVDEAKLVCDWAVDALAVFVRQYPKVQLITSSRHCIDMLTDGLFLKLVIQPLCPSQLKEFFCKWFGEHSNKTKILQQHLDKNPVLEQMITNPLSATILSVTCQNEMPLTQVTATVHQLRLKWLAGVYDHLKSIRRTRVDAAFLLDVAQVIAFGMQLKRVESVDLVNAKKLCLKVYSEPYLAAKVDLAVKELISPTAIMVPSKNGGYDFGHLNVQQYLASLELNNRRDVNIRLLLIDPWWYEVMVLYAQHAREIESVLNEACSMGLSMQLRILAMKMVACRPAKEQEYFNHRIALNHFYSPSDYY